ncbi:MAG: hypothetical protein HYZ49_10715 [Chloroflexi bacterium]|nr:hypothetical protein [Chloroflexota bacterium]
MHAKGNNRAKKLLLMIPLTTLLIAVLGCGGSTMQKPRQVDPFYEGTGDLDSIRIPLLKPYEAINAKGNSLGWYMDLYGQGKEVYFQIQHIEKIAVEKGVIMAFASENRQSASWLPAWYWIVIIPDQNIEIGFENEEDFKKYIQEYGIVEPLWTDPTEVFQEFEKTGCADWIPNCIVQGDERNTP